MGAPLNLSGQRFARLVAIEKAGHKTQDGRVLWKCVCDCGAEVIVTAGHLRSGNTKSCGCQKADATAQRNRDNARHGMTKSPTWISWDQMIQRCTNPLHKSYPRYGGRGIVICKRWLESFEAFLADMGERPDGKTLDRRRNAGNYEPGNCRWSTPKVQSNNRSDNVVIEFQGRSQTIAQWAEELGMSRQALRYRLNNGWTTEEAMTAKLDRGNAWKRGVRP